MNKFLLHLMAVFYCIGYATHKVCFYTVGGFMLGWVDSRDKAERPKICTEISNE